MIKNSLIFSLLLTQASLYSFSQSQEKAYALHILNFAKNIQWPPSSSQSITIGIMNYPPLISEMKNLVQSRAIAGKQVFIKEINSAQDAHDCEILFIPSFKSKSLTEIIQGNKGKSILMVTNSIKSMPGSDINFFLKEGKLSYQIHTKSIESKGLKVPTSIKSMGNEVE